MNNYAVTIRLPFKEVDTLEARLHARAILNDLGIRDDEIQFVKLQQVFDGKAPEKIDLLWQKKEA